MTETEQRWRLRQMPRELQPARDLWPGILAAIGQPPVRKSRRGLAGLALAASLLLAAGLLWKNPPTGESHPGETIAARVVHSESRALTFEYQAALRQFDGAPLPPQIAPSLRTLDRSVEQIRRAIAADPDSVFLLQQLRRTYSRRLALTQRAATS